MPTDLSNITGRLRSAVIARANFDREFSVLLEELARFNVNDKQRVMAIVSKLADPTRWSVSAIDAAVTEMDVRQLLKTTPAPPIRS